MRLKLLQGQSIPHFWRAAGALHMRSHGRAGQQSCQFSRTPYLRLLLERFSLG